MARGTEKSTGVHDVKQRGRRFLTVDIFQLGIGLMAGRTEKGTGVHDVKQRGSRFLTVDIFQLGIGLDTKHITATELTGFRQDLHQVRQFV
ncbi:Uncharacterised protein [Shigella sonnei]|nr:Uncharacterised protein [Shigella sonnei]